MSLALPPAFVARMQQRLGNEWEAFVAALETQPPVSVRLNPQKPSARFADAPAVPWCSEGRYLAERPIFTLDPLYHAGCYYVQEAGSMALSLAVAEAARLRPLSRALDLCAAPGGKTTLLASQLPADCLLIANEAVPNRAAILQENIQRWGNPNVLVATGKADDYRQLAGFFDLVVTDAPCSGEGLWRKQHSAIGEWSPEAVTACATRQTDILATAGELVAEGGILVYSTCTFAPEENEAQVQAMLASGHWRLVPLPLLDTAGWKLLHSDAGDVLGYQAMPHRVQAEGFFLSVLQRTTAHTPADERPRKLNLQPAKLPAAAVPFLKAPAELEVFAKAELLLGLHSAVAEDALHVLAHATAGFLQPALPLGELKGKDFIPAHALALSHWLNPALPTVELDHDTALRFLKKETVSADAAPGIAAICHEGHPLAFAKVLPGGRLNNYLPKQWRIRMELPD